MSKRTKHRNKKSKTCKNRTKQSKPQPPPPLTHGSLLKPALWWFCGDLDTSSIKLHGNTRWSVVSLIMIAVLWTWSDRSCLVTAFDDAKSLGLSLFGDIAIDSYQVLMAALQKYTASLLPLLWTHMQLKMQDAGGEHWRIGGWLPVAVDGSRFSTPQTEANEAAFCAPNYGKGSRAKSRTKWKNKKKRSKPLAKLTKPQIWLTMVWHMGLRLPFCWKTGRSNSSERHHFMDMLKELIFPKKTLFCFDAGFFGYEFCKAINDSGHKFLARVGGNIRLIKGLKKKKRNSDYVFLWPIEFQDKGLPPIELRLITLQGPRGLIYLVTNVLTKSELTDSDACKMYKLRWGIEVQFRTLKQTHNRGTLRSRTPENAIVELHWSLIGLTLIQLFAVKEQIKVAIAPSCSSAALAIKVVQDLMRCGSQPVHDPAEMVKRLRSAIKDNYVRPKSKQGRHRSPYDGKPGALPPIIKTATATQRATFNALESKS